MKRVVLAALAFWLVALPLAAANWQTDYNAAVQAAKSQGRPILVNFTGSDWCGWCIRLKKEVFDTTEFGQYADSKLVLLEVDFPNNKRQTAAQQQANQALQRKYGVRGYPTLFLIDTEGKVMSQLGYMPGGPKAFLGELNRGMAAKGGAAAQPAPAPEPAAAAPAPAPAPAVATVPAPKVVYDKVVLKGITGSTSKPMALINNKTFSPGDAFKVQVGNGLVKVTCVSIAADHVMVQVEGEAEPRQLTVGNK